MGDILSKLQMVSEKIGVTETAHTIEEQVDLISESLDKIPHSTNIAEALDDLSEVAQNINNEEVYIDKTITANGEYLPAEDEATAYSKVTVNVPANFEYITFPTMNNSSPYYSVLCKNNTGIYVLPSGNIFDEESSTRTKYDAYILTPAISIDPLAIESGHVIFTPGENFVFERNGTPISDITGDTITPNDGKVYYLTISRPMGQQTLVVTKTNNIFHHEIKS